MISRLIAVFTLSILIFSVAEFAFGAKKKRSFKRSRLTSDRAEGRADKRVLTLAAGEDKIVDLDIDDIHPEPSKAIIVGNPKVILPQIINVDGKPKQIVFKPLAAGVSTVTVRDIEGKVKILFRVKVAESNLLKIKSEVCDLLKDVEGLKFRIVGRKVIIDGEVLVPNDYGRILSVLSEKAYGDFVLNLATLSPLAMQILAKKIQQDVQGFAPEVRTRVVNGQIWLEGTVENIDQARRAKKVAELYLPELKPGDPLEKDETVKRLPPRNLVQNFIVVNPPPPKKQEKLVRVTVHFVELAKDYQKLFSFKWQPGFAQGQEPQIRIGTNAQGTTGAEGTSFSAVIGNLLPKLNSAQDAGYARILKTGNVVTRSGQAASLSDETTIPFAVTGPNGEVATNSAGVGLTMGVTPLILGSSQDIQMDLEMNQVNLAGRSGTAPITAQHKVKTKLYVSSGESAAVASINNTDVQTSFNKDDPDSGNFSSPSTSPLFNLLRSKSYTKKKSQFVIFVTPQIIDNASDGTKDLKKNFRLKVN